MSSPLDDDARYRAMRTRDVRFDGWFFVAVTSTGIYCRPSCPSVMPGAAGSASTRPRRRPNEAVFGRANAAARRDPRLARVEPSWDVVGAGHALITDGVVDRDGVRRSRPPARLQRSPTPPHARRRSRRRTVRSGPSPAGETARILLETTELRRPMIAFAAGFSSVRQFNETTRGLRPRAHGAQGSLGGQALAARRPPRLDMGRAGNDRARTRLPVTISGCRDLRIPRRTGRARSRGGRRGTLPPDAVSAARGRHRRGQR